MNHLVHFYSSGIPPTAQRHRLINDGNSDEGKNDKVLGRPWTGVEGINSIVRGRIPYR